MAARRKSDLPTIIDPYTGETRLLGSLPSDPRLVASLPPYTGEILPESELREFNDFPSDIIHVKDQDGEPACNGFAIAAAIEGARYVQGMDHVPLSGWYPWAILTNGRGGGSNIIQGYELVGERGCAPESEVAYGTGNPRKFTAAVHEAAKRYRMEFGASYQSWRQVVSGVMLREVMNLSVHVDGGNRFNSLDSEGVAGAPRGVGNHAISVGLGLKKSARWGWLVLMRNSWSTRWGQDGFCWLGEAHIEAGSYFECASVKAVVDDPSDPEVPPLAKALANLPKRTTWTPPEMMA